MCLVWPSYPVRDCIRRCGRLAEGSLIGATGGCNVGAPVVLPIAWWYLGLTSSFVVGLETSAVPRNFTIS